VARQAHNLKVAGSNPAPATKSTKSKHQTSRPRAALLVLNRSFSTNPTIADKTKGKIGAKRARIAARHQKISAPVEI
ncbi:hypothetical protein, partial [Ruegeria arenilitoris]|uniref:hypothetical protein n=1 Tax=Ruegeria arenilitoris TaxID=1173585 RepID=UPI001C2BD64E